MFHQIFLGVAPSPLRDTIAAQFDPDKHKRLVHPCVGKWSIPTLIAQRTGIKGSVLEASDISLYSTLIGLICNQKLTFEQFGIKVPEHLQLYIDGAETRAEEVAGHMLALRHLTIPNEGRRVITAYTTEMQRELRGNRVEYRRTLAERLSVQAALLDGAKYELADVRDVVAEVAERDSEEDFITASLPMYAGDYAKLYDEAEQQLWTPTWDERAFDPAEIVETLGMLTGSKATCVSLMYMDNSRIPEGWTKLLAVERGGGRTDYVITNKPLTLRRAVPAVAKQEPTHLPVLGANDIITRDSKISYMQCDFATGMYYRDLFVHRLGTTTTNFPVLLLIDGKVAASVGLNGSDAVTGRSRYMLEGYGVTANHNVYKKLQKLNTMLLCSAEFKHWVYRHHIGLHMSALSGIQTTTLSKTRDSKIDKGVLKLRSRKEMPNKTWKLVYRGEFNEMTYAETLGDWFTRFVDPPAPATPKKKRQRSQSENQND